MLNQEQNSNPFASKPKSSFLPFLTVLFLISYGLLTMLVVEQGRTIDTQRYLISQLFSDSTELTSLKGKVFRKQYAEDQARLKAQGKAPAAQPPAPGPAARPQNPSSQTQTTQTPSSQVPSSQVTQQEQGSARPNAGKLRKQARPEKPPKISVDSSDIRRNSLAI